MRTDTSEHELIERLKAGDQLAVAELVSWYGPQVYRLALRSLKNHEDAEEVRQDVLLKVYRKVAEFRGDSALSSWIYRIAFNTAMSRLRHRKASRLVDRPDERPDEVHVRNERVAERRDIADWSSMADELVLRGQLRNSVAAAVKDLPAIYRAPVILRDLKGLTTEEASALLKVKDQTLKSRLHRGRVILRKQLAHFADGLSMHHPLAA
jgi:RNA polymerase sigma-70 factor, ECF subfamily